jgi:hypothetical protein
MSVTERDRRRRIAVAAAGAILTGLVILTLLFPASGISPVPPRCFSVLGYDVPCETGGTLALAAVAAGIVGALLWWIGRRSRDR